MTSSLGVQSVGLQSTLDGSPGVASICGDSASRSSGSEIDGIWSRSCTVPDKVLSGTYTVTPYGRDVTGAWTNTNGGPDSATRGSFTISGGYSDVAPATVVSIDVTPAAVTSGQTFTVSAHLTSDVGVDAVELQSTPDGLSGNSSFCDDGATLTSGTVTDGTWSITCTVPSIIAATSYTVTPYLRDVLGQWVNTNGGPLTGTDAMLNSSIPADGLPRLPLRLGQTAGSARVAGFVRSRTVI